MQTEVDNGEFDSEVNAVATNQPDSGGGPTLIIKLFCTFLLLKNNDQ